MLSACAAACSASYISFTDDPVLEGKLVELRAVKKGNYRDTLKKVTEVAAILKTITSVSPTNRQRAGFIAHEFEEALAANSTSSLEKKLICILLETTNIKNALQVEAVFFGGLYPTLLKYHNLYSDPLLADLRGNIPNIFNCINLKNYYEGHFSILISPLEEYFNSVGYADTSDLFDQMMLRFIGAYPRSEDGLFIHIPTHMLPPPGLLAFCFSSPDLRVRMLAQIFYIFEMENEAVLETNTPYFFNLQFLKLISNSNIKQYHRKKELIPYLARLIEAQAAGESSGKSAEEMIISPDFVHEAFSICKTDWQDEAAETYELVRRIEFLVRKAFHLTELREIDEVIEERGCDEMLLRWGTHINTVSIGSFSIKFPIHRTHPFCEDKKEFLELPLYRHFLPEVVDEEVSATVIKAKAGKKGKKKGSPPMKGAAATGGASSKPAVGGAGDGSGSHACAASYTEEVEEHDYKTIVSKRFLATLAAKEKEAPSSGSAAAAACGTSALSPLEAALKESLRLTRAFLSDARYERRVSDFWESEELGLSHRALDPADDAYEAKKAHCVITHDFPPEILLFACNPLFSVPAKIHGAGGLEHNHFSSCVSINSKKYKLTVAFNHLKSCYHLYAEPLGSWANYLNTIKPFGEYPSLAATGSEKTLDFSSLAKDGLVFDEAGNAIFSYRGREIKLIRLKDVLD